MLELILISMLFLDPYDDTLSWEVGRGEKNLFLQNKINVYGPKLGPYPFIRDSNVKYFHEPPKQYLSEHT